MISAQDLKGVLAIMPTPAKEGADRLEATNTIDLDETARLTESLVRDGATGIMVFGTMLILTRNRHGWEMDVLNEAVQQARIR